METEFNEDRPPNYRAEANCFSAFFILWTHRLFQEGKKRDLYETDLPEPLNEHKASYLGNKIARLWSREYYHAKSRREVPSLTKVLCKCFIKEYFVYGIALAFIELIGALYPELLYLIVICVTSSESVILRVPTQPLFIGLLVRYFSLENANNKNTDTSISYFKRLIYYKEPSQSKVETMEAIVYGTFLVLCSVISVCVQHPYMLAVMHLGMKVRVACMSLMYRKTLRMSMLALCPTTVGNIVNLMSNDATRFDIVPMFLHYLWISPLQLILFIYIMWRHVGFSSFIGSTIILIFIPIQIFLAYVNKILRYKTALKTDERVRLMNEIISGIQVIKMYAWEYAFCRLIHMARRREMRILLKTSFIRGIVMAMIMFTARTAVFVTFISFVFLFNEKINAEVVFLITGYYLIMRSTMTLYFPQGVTQFAETLITIKRTRDYLLNEEAIVGNVEILHPEPDPEDEPYVFIDRAQGKSSSSYEEIVSFPVAVPSIRIIEAYARWNKRYILKDIDLIIKNGELVVIIGTVGSGKTSLLHVIIKELPVTEGFVSIKGVSSFSSGQPWLFAGSVRQNIIFGHEFNRDRYRRVCRVCALLKDFQLLPYGDQTIVGERGISLSGGQRARINLARCIYKEADIYVLDDPLSAVDTQVGAQIFEQCIVNFLKNKIRVLVTHQLQYVGEVDQLVILEKGRILEKGSYTRLQRTGMDFAQYLESDAEKPTTVPGTVPTISELSSVPVTISVGEISAEGFYDEQQHRSSLLETRATGHIDCKLYKQYIGSGGNFVYITFVIFLFLVTQGVASASDYFIGQWTKIEESKNNPGMIGYGINSPFTANTCIISYTLLIDLLVFCSIGRSFMFFYICVRASIRLHDEMLESIVFGRMRFFNNNPSGRILNRFSKDMGAVDEDLPYAMIDFFQMLLNLIGVFIILSCTNYYLIPPIIFIIIGIYFLRKYYLSTSRSLKRVEGSVRSYVYAHLNASLQGLSTIRSHGAEEILTYEFDRHMDLHSSAWYLFIGTARAFSVWTDLMCVTLIAVSSYGFIFLEQVFGLQIMSGDVGLAVTQCLTLTGLIPWGMRQSAEMENHMTSVERVKDFINIDQEPFLRSPPDNAPYKTWPDGGEIIFQNTELQYSPHEPPVLRNLNLIISPEEKIGIVGRTGAGKSSLISAVFRLAFQSGSIFIDGIDIFKIGLHDLREKIAIIPQEPMIFTGTLRFNLDPFRQYSDEILLAALSIVELETNARNVLAKSLVEGGSNFSAGEKQLLCLARAIVRNNKILILDEATANMDPQTDRVIQTTIRSKFAKCTVLTIAHRLHTIMDSDRVMVMHAGTCVEFDHPHILLQNENGFFTAMVHQTGKPTADFLKKIAENSFHNKTSFQARDSVNEEEIF